MEAIQATTINTADALNQRDAGVLETGRYAGPITVPGNPANDVTLLENVIFVMKGWG